MVLFALASCSTAQYSSYDPRSFPEAEKDTSEDISLRLELPRQEEAVPFYDSEPSTLLKAPVTFINPPIPATDLTVPKEMMWNPENDPRLYFDVAPANQAQYPKKYIKALYEKAKPHGDTQKDLELGKFEKILYNLAKKDNRASLEKEKVNKDSNENASKKPSIPAEPVVEAATNFEDAEEDQQTAPITINADHGFADQSKFHLSPSGERLQFQMHGMKGPRSYKWGYDTGKG